jgi:DNA-binding transcriptional ArsR family regulator
VVRRSRPVKSLGWIGLRTGYDGSMSPTDRLPSRVLDEGLRVELTELTATLCRALNDPKRLMILHALAEGPASVGDLATMVDATTANVSQHLAVLRERGLVDTERDGLSIIYSLRYPELIDTVTQLRAILRSELARRQGLLVG